MNSILEKIALHKKTEVDFAKKNTPLSQLTDQAPLPIRDFVGALDRKPAIIAEIKKASPSKGLIRANFEVPSIAQTYEEYGACCLSVLTDRHFFQGEPQYLALAKEHCHLPVLRKDFIIDSYQIDESRALGADCILLIVALLDHSQLHDFCQQAQALGMAVLVESHDERELEQALALPTPLMGINNRSLHTFKTDISTSLRLSQQVPHNKRIITESGINTHDDLLRMQAHGIHCFLIGESLMRAENIGLKLRELMGHLS